MEFLKYYTEAPKAFALILGFNMAWLGMVNLISVWHGALGGFILTTAFWPAVGWSVDKFLEKRHGH